MCPERVVFAGGADALSGVVRVLLGFWCRAEMLLVGKEA